MTLSGADVKDALTFILTRVQVADVRLVGTASSVLRGIKMPADDIDILFHDRTDIDAWFGVLSADLDVDTAPAWIADSQQYFARLYSGGVAIELSTVEIETDSDTAECFGEGPWRYFDILRCGAGTIPVVATELRFITEVARGRADRYRPLIDHLQENGCDVALIRRGLANVGMTQVATDRIFAELLPGDHR